MAGDSCATRDQPFRDLLLSVSKQLSESDDVEGLRYLADLGHSPSCSALELLKAMRNKGMFSPHFCSRLAELLRKIARHDLADEVMNKYVAVFPDQASPTVTERGRNGSRRRSVTDPLPPLSKSTSSNLDSGSSGPTSLTQGFVEGQISGDHQCGGSLEHVFPATTTSQSGLDAHEQGATPRDYPHIPPSKTSMSLRSISQSSQSSHSYPSSYASSNSSSYNSLNSATEAVLDRASTMLFNHVTATFSRSLPRGQEFTNTSPAVQLEPVVQTALPSRIAPLSLVHPEHPGALEAIRVSEVYSDQEEGGYEDRRGTLECPAAIASRHKKARQKRLQPPFAENESDSLHPEHKDSELSRTPRASLLLMDETGDLENMTTQVVGKEAYSTDQLPASEGAIGGPPHANKPGLTCKEKQWKRCLNIFGKHKTKRNSGNTITWRVPRDDLGKLVWNHDKKNRCISRSHKFELDTNLGRHNPKLLFQLYPYGESSDCGEYVTMIVRINTSDKCPPLPPSATVQISLTVCDDDNSDGERCVLNRTCVEEHLNLGYFAIRQVVRHGQLKKSRSKYIYFDLEINCSRLDWDSGLRNRRPTL